MADIINTSNDDTMVWHLMTAVLGGTNELVITYYTPRRAGVPHLRPLDQPQSVRAGTTPFSQCQLSSGHSAS